MYCYKQSLLKCKYAYYINQIHKSHDVNKAVWKAANNLTNIKKDRSKDNIKLVINGELITNPSILI